MENSPLILLATASIMLRDRLAALLDGKGRLMLAGSSEQAKPLLRPYPPHLCILDASLPGGEALTMLHRLREGARGDDSYVVILTADDDAVTRDNAFLLGADDVLRMPSELPDLAPRLGIALRHATLMRRLRNYGQRLEAEMSLVAELQLRMLPTSTPFFPGVHIETLYRPSQLASGDYYDHLPLPGGDGVRILMADASGHGARAAFLMSIVRTVVHTSQVRGLGLAQLFRELGSHLMGIIGGESDFVTMFAGDIHFGRNQLEYINAGHCPALLGANDGTIQRLGPTAPLLGFFESQYTISATPFTPGSGLLLFTDGIHDCANASGKRMGQEKFLTLAEHIMRTESDVLPTLEQAVCAAMGDNATYDDDVAALYLRRETEDAAL